ncbi:hypothetical protein, partial [Methylomonas albis]
WATTAIKTSLNGKLNLLHAIVGQTFRPRSNRHPRLAG